MDRLPKRYRRFFEEFPEVGKAYEAFGDAVGKVGPIDDRTRCLLKLAISIGARMEGAAKSHAHKAIQAGISPQEIRQVAVMAAPTIGFPNMMAGLSWVDDVLGEEAYG